MKNLPEIHAVLLLVLFEYYYIFVHNLLKCFVCNCTLTFYGKGPENDQGENGGGRPDVVGCSRAIFGAYFAWGGQVMYYDSLLINRLT